LEWIKKEKTNERKEENEKNRRRRKTMDKSDSPGRSGVFGSPIWSLEPAAWSL
jgi:hypothetical protein